MKIFKVNLRIRDCIDKEYLKTNGIGGYSMATVAGLNTRRYHGVLVAPLDPPAQRHVIVSKLDEYVEIGDNNETVNLATNMSDKYISDGHTYLNSYKEKYYPEFTFKIPRNVLKEVNGKEKIKREDILINKKLSMEHGSNTTVIKYTVETMSESITLNLIPFLNFRDFHAMRENVFISHMEEIQTNTDNNNYNNTDNNKYKDTDINTNINKNNVLKHKYYINEATIPLYISVEADEFEQKENDKFIGMEYLREQERGFEYKENHAIPGIYKIYIPANTKKEINVYLTLDEEDKDVDKIFEEEISRIEKEIQNSKIEKTPGYDKLTSKTKEFLEDLVIATDKFIIQRDKYTSIIAGYPWFLDWGRDSLISFEGLLLKNNRFNEAKSLIKMYAKDIKEGLVPNGYAEYENHPYYNSADASLLLFEALEQYIKYTKDKSILTVKMMKILKNILEKYIIGTDYAGNNIYLDEDYLLNTGTENIQNTWMDAKIDNYVVTPRNGKAVELNSLMYNAIKIYEKYAKEINKEKSVKLADKTTKTYLKNMKESFKEQFISQEGGLKDLIDDPAIRPNQLFSLALSYPIVELDSKLALSIIKICKNKLFNRYGLKTLGKPHPFYVDEYSGNNVKRDLSYHQGITWPWLHILYYKALENMNNTLSKAKKETELKEKDKKWINKEFNRYIKEIATTFKQNLYQKACVMSLSELHNSTFPYDPQGSPAQAWSVAAVNVIVRDYYDKYI